MTWALPSQILAVLTFPGVVLHEIVEQFFCRRMRVAIFKVCYFRFASPPGFIVHEPLPRLRQSLWLGLGPFFVSSALGALIAFPAIVAALEFRVYTLTGYVLAWLGISIAMHSFPTVDNALDLWRAVRSHPSSPLLSTPLAGILYVGAVGRLFGVDLLYGIGVVILAPALLVALLP